LYGSSWYYFAGGFLAFYFILHGVRTPIENLFQKLSSHPANTQEHILSLPHTPSITFHEGKKRRRRKIPMKKGSGHTYQKREVPFDGK
jgi:hypothetical protein